MSLLPARVDLNGQQLYPAIEICDLADLPFDHYHQETHGHDDVFCAWCFHWISTDGDIKPRSFDNCTCDQGCHELGRMLTELV